jgi:hypothetical protein
MGSGGEGILFLTSGTCGKIGAVFEHALTGENANSEKYLLFFCCELLLLIMHRALAGLAKI